MGKKSKKNKDQDQPKYPYTLGSAMPVPPEILAQLLGGSIQKTTVDMVADSAKEVMPENVSAVWRVQSEQACCDSSDRDGIVLTVPSVAQFSKKLTKGNADPRRAHVIVVGVDEHSGDALSMNWDAEMLKKLHNIIPQIIAAAEYQRDDAVKMVESDNGL